MTGQNGAPLRYCQATTRAGGQCGMPPVKGGALCFRHDPSRVEINREHARQAALASHQAADTATMAWAESIRWETPADVQATLREASALCASGGLSPLRADTIRKLAQAWLDAYTVAMKLKPAEEAPPVVHITRYSEESVNHD